MKCKYFFIVAMYGLPTAIFAQLVTKPTFFETQDVSNDGLVSGYEAQAGPYSIWDPDSQSFSEVGGAAPGNGIGGGARFSEDGSKLCGTSYLTQTAATSWSKENIGYNYIFRALQFPSEQNSTGFAIGESLTSGGDGILLATYDAGYSWEELWSGAGQGLEAMSFPSIYTGYVGGWGGYLAKSTDAGYTWSPLSPDGAVVNYAAMSFKDEYSGVVGGTTDTGGAVYVTEDGGESWAQAEGLSGIVSKIVWLQGDTYFLTTTSGDIQKSDDNGYTWTTVSSTGSYLTGISFGDSLNGIATAQANIYRTADGGNLWAPVDVQEGAIWHDAAWHEGHITLVGTPELIFDSTDAGLTWPVNNMGTSTFNEALYDVVFTPNGTGYIVGSQGVIFRKLPEVNQFSMMSVYETATGQWTTLDSFNYPVDGNLSSGYDISGDGSTIVGNSWVPPTPGEIGLGTNAVAWTQSQGLIDLGSLYQNLNKSTRANAVNDDGSVIIGWQDFSGPWKAAVWRRNPDGTYPPNQYLLIDPTGDPEDEYNQLGEALAVSGSGEIIGGMGDYANNNLPWLYSESAGYMPLETLNENFLGMVNGLNHDGSIAIGLFQGGPWDNTIPFIWTPALGVQDLNTFATNTLGIDLGDLTIWAPTAISPNGRYITGWGEDSNWTLKTFRLELPESLSAPMPAPRVLQVNAYPNPTTGTLYIKSSQTLGAITVTAMNGQLLLEKQTDDTQTTIDISGLATGLYMVTVKSGTEIQRMKVMKQ